MAVGEPEMKQECNVDFKIGNGRSSGMEWGMEINMFNGMWNKKNLYMMFVIWEKEWRDYRVKQNIKENRRKSK